MIGAYVTDREVWFVRGLLYCFRFACFLESCAVRNVWTGMQQNKRQLSQRLYLLVGTWKMCET